MEIWHVFEIWRRNVFVGFARRREKRPFRITTSFSCRVTHSTTHAPRAGCMHAAFSRAFLFSLLKAPLVPVARYFGGGRVESGAMISAAAFTGASLAPFAGRQRASRVSRAAWFSAAAGTPPPTKIGKSKSNAANETDAAAAVASRRVFDINLRAPFIDPELCVRHARGCWLLKLNDDELPEMVEWCGLAGEVDTSNVIAAACAVRDALECENLCVTRGGDGAALVASSGAVSQHPGFEVTAVDTVGAGDSFLAALLDALLAGAVPAAALERACRVGAFVATQQGATPAHDTALIEALQSK